MGKTRREFLAETTLGVAAGVMGVGALAHDGAAAEAAGGGCDAGRGGPAQHQPAGAPPVFGTGAGVGPEPSPTTFSEAEKLVQVKLSEAECAQAAKSWRGNMSTLYERRTGPRKVELGAAVVPFSRTVSVLPGHKAGAASNRFGRSKRDPGPVP